MLIRTLTAIVLAAFMSTSFAKNASDCKEALQMANNSEAAQTCGYGASDSKPEKATSNKLKFGISGGDVLHTWCATNNDKNPMMENWILCTYVCDNLKNNNGALAGCGDPTKP